MTKQELVQLIDLAYAAAGESKVGPMFNYGDDGKVSSINRLAENVFYQILTALLPKNIDCNAVVTEKHTDESWK